jgi:hypothetical protein
MASCRLIWHLAWLLWTFLYLKFLIANEIYDKVPCYYLLYKKHRVARVTKCVRRPPIPITVLSETFCVMSHIRLRMSFLLMLPWLTKTIVENERLKGYLTVGTVMAALIGSCLLFRRPPDRFYALPNDVMIHVLPRVAFWRRLVFCAFLGISILFFQSIPSNIYQRAPQTPTTNAENYEQTAFMAKKADDEDIQRDVGDWGSDSIPSCRFCLFSLDDSFQIISRRDRMQRNRPFRSMTLSRIVTKIYFCLHLKLGQAPYH